MTKEEAIKIYLQYHSIARKVVKRIEGWDESKSIKQNAINLGMQTDSAQTFAVRYHLEYSRIRDTRGKPKQLRVDFYKILREAGFTYDNIGKAFGVSRQAIEDGIKRREERRIT